MERRRVADVNLWAKNAEATAVDDVVDDSVSLSLSPSLCLSVSVYVSPCLFLQ